MASIDVNYLCLGCMNTLPHPNSVCPYCKWSRQTSKNNASQLKQGIILTNSMNKNQYIVGKAVGNGGFGIVYVAFDKTKQRKVAIKEYYPSQFVDRDHSGTTVVPKDNNPLNQALLAKQKRRFYQEAEKMQLFNDSPNVVKVFDYFEANDTAYIVMEFVEGQTFAQVLDRMPNKRLTLQDVLSNLKPIITILERIHHTPYYDDKGIQHFGIIHRDISPENIMYAVDGSIKLLDFGAARVSDPGDRPTGIIKPGYAPLEQQLSEPGIRSAQGSWTDVYALAATIYRAITGQIPPNALLRSTSDSLVPPSDMGIQIPQQKEQILLKGLAINYQDRYQSVSQFYNDLIVPIIDKPKSTPMLTISNFTKNGDIYTAFINYNGDGVVASSIGTINGNVLSVENSGGGFNGVITASEGLNSTAVPPISFVVPPMPEPIWKKIAWAFAIVTVIASFLLLNKVKANEIELSNIQKQVKSNEEKLEKYRNFAADYGYASLSYYADKAIIFINKNSEVKVPIYCDLLSEELKAFLNVIDGDSLISVKWESAFNSEHKANIIISAGDKEGYSTIHFTNEVNNDAFDVLVVVQ